MMTHQKAVKMKFKYGSVMTVSGPSQAGKSKFIENILLNPLKFFDSLPYTIIWHYGEIAPKAFHKDIFYQKGLPTWDTNRLRPKTIIVIDDLMQESRNAECVSNLFTRVAHHQEAFVIFITQNVFQQSSQSRTRNLNTHYLVLFKNPRDLLTIQILQKQMQINYLIDAYLDATTNKPHSYILMDFRQETPDNQRIRTDIHGEEIIYKPKVHKQYNNL